MTAMNRRKFLKYAATVAGGGLLALGLGSLALRPSTSPTSSSTQGSTTSTSSTPFSSIPDYQDFLSWLNGVAKPYSKTTLNITLEEEFGPLTIQLLDQDFAAASGMNDLYSIKPYSLQLSDVSLMFSTKSSTYDVFGIDNQNLGVFPKDSISPIQLAETYPDLTYPGLDIADFNKFIWDHVATYPPSDTASQSDATADNTPVLPLDAPTQILYYRKDVYDQLGLTPAKTWDEHYSNLQTIQESKLTPFGGVSMAAPDISIVYEFLTHVASFGGDIWVVDGNTITPNLLDDKVQAALEDFVRLAKYSDTASGAYTWDDVFSSLAHGVSASGLLWDGFATWLNDPTRSVAAGNMAYARTPAGPAGSFSTFAGGGVGVSKFSKNPAASWLWMQWATAKGTQEAAILDKFHIYPTRDSPLKTAQVSEALTTGALQAAAVTNDIFQSKSAVALIGFPKWFNALFALSTYLNMAWTRRTSPTNALTNAQNQILSLGALTF